MLSVGRKKCCILTKVRVKPQWHGFSFHLYWHWPSCDIFREILPPENFRDILNMCHHGEVLSTCQITSWYFCVFLCPDGESPDYQRAPRPWRTAVSKLTTRYLFWFFPAQIFFKLQDLLICRLVHTYYCGYRYLSN